PKGVAIEHASAAAMVGWAREAFPPSMLAGVLASTSICFDLSVFEIFVPLSWGGRVILAENALALPALPAAAEVTLVNTVPSAIAGLVRSGALPSGVRTVNLAGEALQRELVEEIYRQPGVGEVRNLYGPSEDTTYSTWTVVPAGSEGQPAIGRPLAGTRVYLLDARFEPAPLGVPGELYLAGAGLARGYLGRPELTAERFLPDPFSRPGGERLYRTGDLARYRLDGDLEYLGRIDHQVKVRGFRIELGEIESALAHHPEVAAAAVLVREEAAGDRGLVAYVAPREPASALASGHSALAARLRSDLRKQLPDYMIPGRFAFLPRLPLTPNGKVDRKALAAIPLDGTGAESGAGAGFVPPRTPAEELVAGIWAQLLGLPRVGAEDNFFDLGGHSLLATRLAARLHQTFGVTLPLRRLFEAPTVAAQAVQVEAARTALAVPVPPIVPAPRDSALPLSFSQERLWFIDQFEPGRSAYNIPTALRCEGALDIRLLGAAFDEVARRHESLRTTFAVAAGGAVQVIAPPRPFVLPLVDLSGLAPALRDPLAERLVAAAAWRPFDLARGPLFRALALRLEPAEHALLLTLHHIISDAWSMEVLIREVALLYRAFWEGRPSPLPPPALQFADFAVWQRQWLEGEVLDSQIAFWRARLAGAPPVLDLPLDFPRPAVHTWNGAREGRRLPAALGESLAELSRRGQATLFMSFLAAWDALLLRWTGQSDLSVGTPIAGRGRPETENLIGFFVNTLVLRADLAGRPGFAPLLAQVRETALDAYAHQDVPFEQLIAALGVERSLEHTPLFQVMLVLQQPSVTDAGLDLPEMRLSPIRHENRTAKFDLTLMVQPGGDGFQVLLGYNTDLFRRDTIARLLGHLESLLSGMVADPERPIADLPLLTEPERHQLLLGWNDNPATATADLSELCLHQLFEGWAARRPGAPAAVLGGDLLTYGDLDRRAGRLAARLRELGVGPEVRVGLCLPRSFDLLVALLAVLKAGGAYVPLDPANPRDRLLFLLEDSRVPVLLTVRGLAEELGEQLAASPTRVICLDEEPEGDEVAGNAFDAIEVSPDNLAYVIYTSGSTGTPNGVLVAHRGAVNLIREAAGLYRVTPESRVLQTASVGFDASVLEIFLAL
ncbi:MAG: hypothetical protein QOJ16_2822, partial [Acidobacteriota bacterium]|nr:hypothetical protein [Acidobacteriota bacterium]